MKKYFSILIVFSLFALCSFNQGVPGDGSTLTIEKIMQDPDKWIGALPENIYWSENGEKLFFEWNPEGEDESSLYYITTEDHKPQKVTPEEEEKLPSRYGSYNKEKTKKVFTKHGDVYLLDIKTGKTFRITNTLDYESSPEFNYKENKDRWIMMLDERSGDLKLLDHQHDEAWIGGPGVGWWGGGTLGWMPDSKRVYFQSEESGYSHLYIVSC